MIYITGDTHGKFERISAFCAKMATSQEDVIIILGDAGINYYGGKKDIAIKRALSELPVTLFCIHGNHEIRPETIPTYEFIQWSGGTVCYEKEFPNLLFAKDGEFFNLNNHKCIVIGGAYSVDKFYRLERNFGWWADEQPSDSIKAYVERQLESIDYKVDIVLSHTCPLKYEPREVFLPFIDQSAVDKSTEQWLDTLEEKIRYTKWYCGHYHLQKSIDKLQFLFDGILPFAEHGAHQGETE